MSLAAPLWLLLLLPWALVALWLLRGYRPTALVPFLHLWPNEPPPPEQRRRRRLPPWPIILLLAAALLAILAAGRPELPIAGRVRPPLIIVDRGITQLAADRYATLIGQAAPLLESSCLSETVADVRFVPGPTMRIAIRDLSREILARPVWPVDTRAALSAAVEQARHDVAAPGNPPILVLSDQAALPTPPTPGVIRASSGRAARNVGIESVAAVDEPSSQVMLRLRNDSPQTTADITISSAGHVTSKTIKLPPPGESADLFTDLPALGGTVDARINTQDDLAPDNAAYLVREGRAVRPVARTVLPPELTRMIDVHNRLHAGQADAADVDISTAPLAPATSGVLLPNTSGQPTDLRAATHADNSLLRNLTLPQDAVLATQAPGEGWTVVASVNSTPVLAIREKPARQVWVGFRSPSWPNHVDFVIFWTNVFNWLGGQQSRFVSQPTHILPAGWEPVSPAAAPATPAGVWPGLYRRDAAVAAINSPAPTDLNATAAAAGSSWQEALRQEMSAHPAQRDLTPWLALAAMLLVLTATVGQAMRKTRGEPFIREPDLLD